MSPSQYMVCHILLFLIWYVDSDKLVVAAPYVPVKVLASVFLPAMILTIELSQNCIIANEIWSCSSLFICQAVYPLHNTPLHRVYYCWNWHCRRYVSPVF